MDDLKDKIVRLADELNLKTFKNYKKYLDGNSTTEQILYDLLSEENDVKQNNRYKYRLKNAGLPFIKTLDTFEFDQNSLPKLKYDTVMNLANCEFVKDKRNIVAIGNPGTGKTHLLVAICLEAIQRGYSVKFRRAQDLVTQMTEAVNEKNLSKYIKTINVCDILLIDEMGYLSFDISGASLLFQIFASRYETRSTIVTSNLEFSQWINFLGKDEHMTSALIGRLIHLSTILNMNGDDYRLKKTRERGGSL